MTRLRASMLALILVAACGASTPPPTGADEEARRDPPRVGTDEDPRDPTFDAGPARDGGAPDAAPAATRPDGAKPLVVATGGDDCTVLADRLIALMISELGESAAAELRKQREKMIDECKKKPPTEAERACLMRATKMTDIFECVQKK